MVTLGYLISPIIMARFDRRPQFITGHHPIWEGVKKLDFLGGMSPIRGGEVDLLPAKKWTFPDKM